jgi:hypothetical protein
MSDECRTTPRHDRGGMAGVIALTIVAVGVAAVAACGGKIDGVGSSSGTSGTSTSTASPPSTPTTSKRPPPPPPDDPPGDECPKNVAVTTADLDAQIGFKPPPAPAPGACSTADITTLEAAFKDTTLQSWFDLGKNLPATCKACVFSKDTDPTWSMIVGTAADNGQTGFLNFGACFANAESLACGKSLQYQQFCQSLVCNECAVTSTERQKCIQKATTGPCASFAKQLNVDCPKLNETQAKCSTIFDGVRSLCGG